MSASVEELRADLRLQATKKRAAHFEEFKKSKELSRPQNLAAVIGRLNELLAALSELIASQGNRIEKDGPVKFEVTERDADGNIKSFKAG